MVAVGTPRFVPFVVWPAWVALSVIASLIPILPNLFNLPPYSINLLGIQQSLGWNAAALAACVLAVVQYVVISALLGKVSGVALMWIPASVLTVLVSGPIGSFIRLAIPINSVFDSLTRGRFPYPLGLSLNEAALGLMIGLTQGVILAMLFKRRSLIAVWMLANAAAGLAVGIAWQFQFQPVAIVHYDPIAAAYKFASVTAVDGGLYAAVTGLVLVAVATRRGQISTRVALGTSPAGGRSL